MLWTVAVLLLGLAAAELPAQPPAFSWDKIPLFWHAANSTWYDEPTLSAAASFPLVTVEKFQSIDEPPAHREQEKKIVKQLELIKARNASVTTLAYLNTALAFPQYSLFEAVNTSCRATCFLHNDDDGSIFEYKPGLLVYDLSVERARSLWLASAASMLASAAVDGIFADRGRASAFVDFRRARLSAAHRRAWDAGHVELMTAATNLSQSLSGPRGLVVANGADVPGVNGRMIENLRVNDSTAVPPGNDIELLQADAGRRVVEAHADNVPAGTGPDSPLAFNASLAAYLVGCSNHTYFQATAGWATGQGWMDQRTEYGLPLGPPTGLARVVHVPGVGEAWERSFAGGARVFLDRGEWKRPCILWPVSEAAPDKRFADYGYVTGRWQDCEAYM